MENDVLLLQQLLALGDSIQELKSRSQAHDYSRVSLNSLEEENDDHEEWWSSNRMKGTFDNSVSAVTNLYVDDEPKENKQYFSRKNSVLRIPIPPRSCNRMSANEKLHRRLSRLSQRCEQLHQQQTENSSQTENDSISRRNLTYPTPCQTKPPPASSATITVKQTFGTTDTRISSGSIDSGIRDESCSNSSAGSLSPFLKDEKS
uniref:SCHIP-1 domain-containing protein n=1 Tax=Elaeophora elaphi TaxID=1147741 RepID=A0A0R3RR64_9BILA